MEEPERTDGMIRAYSPEKAGEFLLESTFLKSALWGRSIRRYEVLGPQLRLIVPYEITAGTHGLASESKLTKLASKTLEYLRECKSRLDEREKWRFKEEGWYRYGRPQNLDLFEVPQKIVLPDVCNRGMCFLDEEKWWLLDTAYGLILKPNCGLDLRYLLSILNSPILTYFLKETGTPLRGGYFRMKTAYLNPLPIRSIDFSNPIDKTKHDHLVTLVQRMLDLHKRLVETTNPNDKTRLQRQIDETDREIDRLIYDLYDLTEEEIANRGRDTSCLFRGGLREW